MPSEEFPYRTATAFRTALRDRLTTLAHSGGHTLDDLQRQLAYDRLLARTFTAPDASSWVLKGAGALLARLPDARHSRDIDLAFTSPAAHHKHEPAQYLLEEAVSSLHAALDTDLGDFFRFEATRTGTLPEASKGRRIHVVAYLGARYATFHIDIVVGTAMTGTPQPGPPLVPLHIPGLIRPAYHLFPLPDHIADKLCAILEIHHHLQGPQPSTRVKDLVDLALIAQSQDLDAAALSTAIRVGAAHRGLLLPPHFAVPDNPLWRNGYPSRAREAPGAAQDFDAAQHLVAALLDPVLNGTAHGTWDPHTTRWA